MTREERESAPAESFDMGYHLVAQQKHKERVAKNGDRIAYAIKQLEENNIEYVLKNVVTGHFHCRRKSDDALIQFFAGYGVAKCSKCGTCYPYNTPMPQSCPVCGTCMSNTHF